LSAFARITSGRDGKSLTKPDSHPELLFKSGIYCLDQIAFNFTELMDDYVFRHCKQRG
jgi:hypothetical protein